MAHYSQPHRAYHTLAHINQCFSVLDPLLHLAERPTELQLAVWFHDVVYDPRASNNEETSSNWATEAILKAGADHTSALRVAELIMATKHDGVPIQIDEQLLVDADLAILGAPEDRFWEYERQVRQEYAWVPEPVYRQARRDVLVGFVNRATIYSTVGFREVFEVRARSNLEASLRLLTG